ncbi:hypothetical protein [Streptomyces sp. AK08-02]|uniref:hypothetical protein n=1 Tax=Streptomyces sp. AK08-02 TaxID=3028654 RepID=UPI0029C00B7F|nr:hypothetical protein [Streptomyces sp. AK08-02]
MSLSSVEERVRDAIGMRMFTVLAWVPERRALRRVHSRHPVGGKKTVVVAVGRLEECIAAQQPNFGPDRAEVREIFADHDLIELLGCGSISNVPVLADGRTLGVLSIPDTEGTYDDDAAVAAESLAPPAVSALLNLEKESQ